MELPIYISQLIQLIRDHLAPRSMLSWTRSLTETALFVGIINPSIKDALSIINIRHILEFFFKKNLYIHAYQAISIYMLVRLPNSKLIMGEVELLGRFTGYQWGIRISFCMMRRTNHRPGVDPVLVLVHVRWPRRTCQFAIYIYTARASEWASAHM